MNTMHTPLTGGLFRRGLAVVLLALFGMLFMLNGTAHAATPTAGTVIGNQATATYKDATNVDRTATSNLVQTTVSQVKSYTLDQNNSKTASPGQTVYFPHTITNTGNGTDTVTLVAPTSGLLTNLTYYADANGDGLPDSLSPITSTGPLLPGQQFKFIVGGIVPITSTLGTPGTVIVNTTDTFPTALFNTDSILVSGEAIGVTKSMTVDASPASPVTLTVKLTYTNAGTLPATGLVLTDAIPAGLTYVLGSGRWTPSGAIPLTDAAAGDPAGIAYDSTANTVTATIASVAAGVSSDLSFKVTVNSTTVAPLTLSNTATYRTNENTAVKNTNAATYIVTSAAGVVANGSATISANLTAEPVQIAAASQGGTVTFTDYIWNTGNGVDSFDLALSPNTTNQFPAGTTFQLLRTDGSSLIDTNGNGIPDTGPMTSGAVYPLLVRAILPPSAPQGPGANGLGFQVVLTATSKLNPASFDTVINTLQSITALTVDLTNTSGRIDSNPIGTATSGNAATTGFGPDTGLVVLTQTVSPSPTATTSTTFKLVVNNTSPVADSYIVSTIAGIPAGWTVVLKADTSVAGDCSTTGATITNTGTIAAGANQTVCAVVTLPASTSGQVPVAVTPLTFQVQSATNALIKDTIIDAVSVLAVVNVSLTPNGTQQTFPGGSVTYAHTLTNTGNAAATVTFPALTDTQAGFTSAVYLDANGNGVVDGGELLLNANPAAPTAGQVAVAPNSSVQLLVRVFAPASAVSSTPADVTTIIGNVIGGSGTTQVSVTDTTSVTDGLLLEKTQKTVDCTVVAAAGGYTAAPIAASTFTAPGQCIAYQVKATNTTAGVITNLNISDIVPANTSLKVTCGAPSVAGVSTGTAAYIDGYTGAISSGPIATLASTASTTLTFCVRINP